MSDDQPVLQLTIDGNVVSVDGDIDAASAALVAAQLDASDHSESVVLSMAGVGFIDSTGLRVIIDAHQRFAEAGGRLVLSQPSAPVSRLIEIAGLADYLNVE